MCKDILAKRLWSTVMYSIFFIAAMLSIWRPSSDLIDSLKEGKRFKLHNLACSKAR